MEIVYFVDSIVTRSLQWLARNWERITHQPFILLFLSIYILISLPIVVFVNNSAKGNPYMEVAWMIIFIGIIALIAILSIPTAMLLELAHNLIDKEAANDPDKEIGSGYFSWGIVFSSLIIFYLISEIFSREFLGAVTAVHGIVVSATEAFIRRRRGSGRKQKQTVTEKMRKLLEKCTWLPKPSPQPAKIQT